jgi:hypothetical protein
MRAYDAAKTLREKPIPFEDAIAQTAAILG